jgi:regulator of sirC expression with transglutaminase-like and TPR domain
LSHTLFYFQWTFFLAFGLSFPASAQAATRTWEFDLPTPGTYELHVQHDYNAAPIPRGAEVSYSFQTKEKTTTRTDPFYRFGDGHPYIVLIVDVPSPQKVNVVMAGIPQPFMRQAKVYVIDADSRYPYEWFDAGKSVDLKAAQQIHHILKQPEQDIDLGQTKLTIDKHIDPSIDIQANLQKVDAIVNKIRAMPEFGVSSESKLSALKRYLYEAGEWNGNQPYRYDLDDPLGTKISNKLLSNYLVSKKGNCVTMPFLFIILGQRLGLDVTAASAPLHVFVKYRDEAGTWYNLEATSGANPTRDVWYRQQLPMSDRAVVNGVYLQPLTKKETVALMAKTLTERYVDQHEFEKVITLSDLILEYYPKDVSVMIRKSNAYFDLMNKYYAQKYRSPNDIPDRAKGHYLYLSRNSRLWANKAEDLGWQEYRRENDEKYLLSIKQAKNAKP